MKAFPGAISGSSGLSSSKYDQIAAQWHQWQQEETSTGRFCGALC